MKKFIKHMLQKLGFELTRYPHASASGDPYVFMQHFCERIPAPVIFDVGAHHGHISILLSNLLPNAQIYAFEPFPESFSVLQDNTRGNSHIHCFNFGLSDNEGVYNFYSNPSSQTNSLFSTDENGPTTWGKGLLETKTVINAQFKTLDSVVRELDLPKIDILKMDVQGAEHLVLKGAEQCCSRKFIHLVFSEIIIQPTYQGQLRFDDALTAFYDRGFDLYHLFELSRDNKGYLRQLDALFVQSGKTLDHSKTFDYH